MSRLLATIINYGIGLLFGVFFTAYAHWASKKKPDTNDVLENNTNKERLVKMGRTLGPILIVINIILILNTWQNPPVTQTRPPMDLEAVVIGINQKLPMMVDEITRLDSVTSKDRMLIYTFTVNISSLEAVKIGASGQINERVTSTAYSNPDFATFFEEDITITVNYFASDSELITSIQLPPPS